MTEYSDNIYYLIGFITADGSLNREGYGVLLSSKDKEILVKCKSLVQKELYYNDNQIKPDKNGIYNYRFYNKSFYKYLISIGLTPNKSLTISTLDIPDNKFKFFLRGVIDGDGSIIDLKKKNTHYLNIAIYSGSREFLNYLELKIRELFNGINQKNIYKGVRHFGLRYSQREALIIGQYIYDNPNIYLKRKYDKYKSLITVNKLLEWLKSRK